jgi:ribonuclease E
MPNKMLIDASHPEETRVVVTRGNRIEEFDFESQDKKQLKGNIYLARVTRVEPSLQAAFVEYGGNRHGFLAFSEIHPDYYQIPVADRQALLKAEAEAAEAEDDDEDHEERADKTRGRRRRRGARGRSRTDERPAELAADGDEEAVSVEEDGDAPAFVEAVEETDVAPAAPEAAEDDDAQEADSAEDAAPSAESGESEEQADKPRSMPHVAEADVISEPVPVEKHDEDGHDEVVESVGAEDAMEEARVRRKPLRRNYKIQEVIKRRQILLVQVVKEERGNKGAALTTYLSLAGRYSVLMPNTARGGGISRKITNAADRKRLKDVVKDLEVPQGMGVILRTAGESRTKAEIKRDYEYLMRMWENVRNLTLQSSAPALVYEEGSLIKRSVRDLYNKDIDEILVAGEEGYREAKDFMRMLMPSHAKVVQPYRDTVPIFARNGIEAQLDKMLQPQVTLKSGGYIIINQTEALVSIDVNSGRSTREHSIEDTALQTNLEAAEEVARQLRLRDLAGLIVIDFIDMEENRNNRAVEKRIKECLKNDRARIQIGRISHFGLLEMSRQRIRASVLESTMKPCPHCGGTGHVRSDSSVALAVIRGIEDYLLKDARSHITVRTPVATALYVLNHKRNNIVDLEKRFGLTITLEADETLGSQHYSILRGAPVENPVTIAPPSFDDIEIEDDPEIVPEEDEAAETVEARQGNGNGDGNGDRRRKRRRRRRGGRDNDQPRDEQAQAGSAEQDEDSEADSAEESEAGEDVAADSESPRKRRRGRRGGRRNRREGEEGAVEGSEDEAAADAEAEIAAAPEAEAVEPAPADEASEPVAAAEPEAVAEIEATPEIEAPAAPVKKARAPRKPRRKAEPEAVVEETQAAKPDEAPAEAAASTSEEPAPEPAVEEPKAEDKPATEPAAPAEDRPRRTGWWQRKSFF